MKDLKLFNCNKEPIDNEKYRNSINNIYKGYINLWYKKDRLKSFNYFLTGYEYAKKTNNNYLIKFSLLSILRTLRKNLLTNDFDFDNYLHEFYKMCSTPVDFIHFYNSKFNLLCQTTLYNEKSSKKELFKDVFTPYDSIIKNVNLSNNLLVVYYNDKGNSVLRSNPSLSTSYFKKVLSLSNSSKFSRKFTYLAYSNLSRISSMLNEPREGLNYLNLAKKFKNPNDSLKNNIALKVYKAIHFAKLKKYDSAYFLSEEVRKLGYLFNFQKHNTEISKIREELETEKKEKEIAQQKQQITETKNKQKQTKNQLVASLLFLLFGGTTALLVLNNSRKKRKLAEQAKELEYQKNIMLLKEQELNAINAMVEGQEKERKRIAEDLHDNVGSVLATLKLHFENLKLNREKKQFNQEELYEKTEHLIDETYAKIRHIAHEKNAGVIANQGLLTAVKIMAEKISSANKTNIEVIDFGLDKRLENTLEISVFRIIQELTTNILKHAEAKNATINISLYDNELNIIIEDNGKGFLINKLDLKNGMGLNSIQTRITYLNGTFDIDSGLGNGTTIIINIPIKKSL